jgi:cytochrome c
MKKTISLVILAGALTVAGFSTVQQANTAPLVKLVKPLSSVSIKAGSPVSYTIEVADKEDGQTKYEEIASTEVYLAIQALGNTADQQRWLDAEKQSEPTLRLMKQQICFNCHAVKQKLVGPSFAEITKKYAGKTTFSEYLAGKIINGSKGVWGDSQVMPSHPEITKAEAVIIARWIQEKGKDAGYDLLIGTEGNFTAPALPPNSNKPAYVLVPNYLDHGLNGTDRKTGQQVVLIPATR